MTSESYYKVFLALMGKFSVLFLFFLFSIELFSFFSFFCFSVCVLGFLTGIFYLSSLFYLLLLFFPLKFELIIILFI